MITFLLVRILRINSASKLEEFDILEEELFHKLDSIHNVPFYFFLFFFLERYICTFETIIAYLTYISPKRASLS